MRPGTIILLLATLCGCAGPARGVRDALRRNDIVAALGAYERFVDARGEGDADVLADVAMATLTRLARSADPGDRSAGFSALRSMGSFGVDALEALARSEGVVGDRAAAMLWELQGREGVTPRRLLDALRSDERERRLAGMSALRPRRARRRLLRLLADADPAIRAAAARSLGGSRHASVTEALIARLRDDDDDDVRASCARSLGRRGPEANAALVAALTDRATFVRMAVPSALAAAALDDAREALGPLLVEPYTGLSIEAARALAARGDDGAARYLLRAMRADRPAVRAQAAVAATSLVRAHARALAALLSQDDAELALRVAAALSRVDDHRDAAIRALRRLAGSPDGFVAVRALQVLAARGDAGVSEPLRQALGAPEAGVRRVAVMAWSDVARSGAEVDVLAPLLRDGDRSVVALAALQIVLIAAR